MSIATTTLLTMSAREIQLCGDISALISKALMEEFIATIDRVIPKDHAGLTLKLEIASALDVSLDGLTQRVLAALAQNEKTA